MEEKTKIKRMTFSHREGGSRTVDKDGNEIITQSREGTKKKHNTGSGSLKASTGSQSEDKKTDKDN